MAPAVTVLQLDTRFPRVAGDVACPETYCGALEVIRIPNATVGQIVSDRPGDIDIAPFEQALKGARGDIIVTSCGFLSFWQDHLEALTDRPFISSSLTALDRLSRTYNPDALLTVTFDATRLNARHFGAHSAYASSTIGLPQDMHLRCVIAHSLPELDTSRATDELVAFVAASLKPSHQHLLFECTNLPPYKAAIQSKTGLPVSDILTCIEAAMPGAVRSQFLR